MLYVAIPPVLDWLANESLLCWYLPRSQIGSISCCKLTRDTVIFVATFLLGIRSYTMNLTRRASQSRWERRAVNVRLMVAKVFLRCSAQVFKAISGAHAHATTYYLNYNLCWADCLSREQVASLTVHVEILSRLNRLLDEWALVEMGKLEQDLVYGNATSKEVVTFLGYHQALPPEAKVSTF